MLKNNKYYSLKILFTTFHPLSACHPSRPLVFVGLPSYTRAGAFPPALLSCCGVRSWGGCWVVVPQHPKSLAGTMPCGCVMEWIWVPAWSWGQEQPDSQDRGTQTPASPTTTSLPASCPGHPRNDPFPPGFSPPAAAGLRLPPGLSFEGRKS